MIILKRINVSWQNKSELKRLIRLLGSCFYLGYLKRYPSIFGTLPGIVFFLITKDLALWIQSLLLLTFIGFSILISEKMEEVEDTKDPEELVLDETVGMWVSLFGLWDATLPMIIFAFLLFRALDHLKPFPLNIFQTFKGGWGLVSDDIATGMLVNILLRLLLLKGLF